MQQEQKDKAYQSLEENAAAAEKALREGDFILAVLLTHSATEMLLRVSLHLMSETIGFLDLVQDLMMRYQKIVEKSQKPVPDFLYDLSKFAQFRDMILGKIAYEGYQAANSETETAARAGVQTFQFLRDWMGLQAKELRGEWGRYPSVRIVKPQTGKAEIGKIHTFLSGLAAQSVYLPEFVVEQLKVCGLEAGIGASGELGETEGVVVACVQPGKGRPGIYSLELAEALYELLMGRKPETSHSGPAFHYRSILEMFQKLI